MSDLFFFESSLQMPLVHLPLRSTLVKLENQKRVLISPVNFTEQQLSQLQQTPPTDIVAPSNLHHLYAQKAHELFPKAKLWATPALQKKCANINWTATLTENEWPYGSELPMTTLTGAPKMCEVVFFHRKSKTLIVTDLFFNLKNLRGFKNRLLYGLLGTFNKPAVSRLFKLFTKDRDQFKTELTRILKFDFEKIVMAHGEITSANGKQLLTQALHDRHLI